MTSQPDTVTDIAVLSHITRIVEVFHADAAADEQLAGQMLQLGGGALADLGGAGPGIGWQRSSGPVRGLVSAAEGTHGAIMITSRTWTCDPYLGGLAHEVFTSSTYMAQLLQHSDVLRALRKTSARCRYTLSGVRGCSHSAQQRTDLTVGRNHSPDSV